MKTWLLEQLLAVAVPIVVGALSFYAVQAMKALLVAVDNAGASSKAAIAFAVTAVITVLAKYAGDALPPACILDDGAACAKALTDPDAMKTLLAFLVATALNAWRKAGSDRYRSTR